LRRGAAAACLFAAICAAFSDLLVLAFLLALAAAGACAWIALRPDGETSAASPAGDARGGHAARPR